MPLDYHEIIAPVAGTRFNTLRRAQELVLEQYANTAYRLGNIAVELPTGAGKTLIALLVLDYWRRGGNRVAVLTGNKTLARQIEVEAQELGVPTVRFEGQGRNLPARDLRSYSRGQAIALMNYWAYINQNPAMDAADYLVLDDAQLADGALNSMYSVQVSRYHHRTLFASLMRVFARVTDSPIAHDFVREIAPGPSAFRNADLVPFSYFERLRGDLEVMVDDYVVNKPDGESREVTDLGFRWERVRPTLDSLLCFLSPDEVELRPVCYPAKGFEGLSAPAQRIFMSATLHDAGDLQRRLGSDAITKIELPVEAAPEQDGRRLLVFNQQAPLSPQFAVSDEVLAPLKELLTLTRKSVWLCSSGSEADHWASWLREWADSLPAEQGVPTDPIWRLTPTGDELEQFRGERRGHLLIAGRFEGMDFPGDVCRLAVLPSLPSAAGLLEKFTTEQLRDATFQRLRVLERVKQAIGRCTRGDDDFAIYFFLDPRFYVEMESVDFNSIVSDRTRRQVELGLRLTEEGMGNVVPSGRTFLRGDFREFDALQAAAEPPPLRNVRPLNPSTSDDEVQGWFSLVDRRDFDAAQRRFGAAAREIPNSEREHRAFWRYQEAWAAHLRATNNAAIGAREQCLTLLDQAIRDGNSSSWFNRLRRAANQMRGDMAVPAQPDFSAVFELWDQYVEMHPYQGGRFLRWQARLQTFVGGTHDQVCEALEVIGSLLGFAASRPQGNAAADGLWQSDDGAITIEAKIEARREDVVYTDVNQADGQRRTAVQSLGLNDRHVDALIVTNLQRTAPEAEAALGRVRILSRDNVERLRVRLQDITRDYWSTWSREDADARLAAREAATVRLPPMGWLARVIPQSQAPFISQEELFADWP